MPSRFNLFQNVWGNREDFPIELDIKYALMEIQSHVYAKDQMHPIFFTICDIINKHEKSIVRNSVQYFKEYPDHLFHEIINIYVFEKMIPNIINYIRFCQRNFGTDSITRINGYNHPVSLRESIYYLWMEELPHNLWLPFYDNHPVHLKYYQEFDARIQL